MTKKKRELIDILLDSVKPEDWPEGLPFAAQDKDCTAHYYSITPTVYPNDDEFRVAQTGKYKNSYKKLEPARNWNKTIVHRDEFMKRWNERNTPVEVKTLTFSREVIDPVILTEKMEKISIKQDADSEGWIEWSGGEMPVEKGTLIDVKYRCGIVNLHVRAGELPGCGSITYRHAIDFKHDNNPDDDIIAYRLHVTQQQKNPQQLALEKFGTDWHENEGVQPVNDKVLIDLIMCNGDEKKKYLANHWSWHKEQLLKIKKWRIHSDEKESQIDKAAKSLSEGVEKLNGVLLTAQQAFDGLKKPDGYLTEVKGEWQKDWNNQDDGTSGSLADPMSSLSIQIGGDHYTKLAIQPMQYSMKNKLDPLQHTIIKYVTRFRDKAGIEDLEKAKHCIDMLIEFERDK